LAERSHIAASEISNYSADSVKLSTIAQQKMEKLVPEVEQTLSMVKQIVSMGIEQQEGTNQVSKAIEQLNDIAQQNAQSSEELSEASDQLANQSKKLKEIVQYFKV